MNCFPSGRPLRRGLLPLLLLAALVGGMGGVAVAREEAPTITPRATAVGSPSARAIATPTFAGVAATAAPIPNNPLADVTSGQGVLSSTIILRFVATCSLVAIVLAVLLAVRHRRQMEARRDE